MSRSILLVDDDTSLVDTLDRFFTTHGWEVGAASDVGTCLRVFERLRPDVTVLDLQLPGVSGLELLRMLLERNPDAAVLLLTGHGDVATAVDAMKLGAETFLEKPIELGYLETVVDHAREKVVLRRQARYYSEQQLAGAEAELGTSPAMRAIADQVALLAGNDATVLLQGETGTGKGHIARLIHALSGRARRPFVELNCAGLTATFLDSELFGHERGAFTDAKERKVGLFQIADGGTLFLDEVGELGAEIQPKLLNVLETRRFRRLGGTREIEVNVRLIAATNRDLREQVKAGRFREDLFYRLAILPLQLPPLRERGEDTIVELAARILTDLRHRLGRGPVTLRPEALRALVAYRWPGNIRELHNVVERALLLTGTRDEIRLADLTEEVRSGAGGPAVVDLTRTLATVERRYVLDVLNAQGGNVSAAARVLGISRSSLYEKLRRYQRTPKQAGSGE